MNVPDRFIEFSKIYTKEFRKKGVYKIFFNDSKKVYIGSTTDSFKKRFQRHLIALRKNKHHSIKLQNAYNKYGESLMKIEILEVLTNFTKMELLEQEQFWMDFYDAYKKGYNSTKRADNSMGFKMYEEVVAKRRIPVLQYDLEGNFIREWKGAIEVNNNLGLIANPESVFKSSNFSSLGFLWRKKTENYSLKIDKYVDLTKQEIYQYSLNGDFIKKWDSILSAAKELHIPVGNICHHLQEEHRICYGYYFSRQPKEFPIYRREHPFQKKIIITNLTTNEILEFYGKREVCRKLGISRSTIRSALDKNNGIMSHKQLKVEEV